jgi:trans-aconitate 2-methyltransferase
MSTWNPSLYLRYAEERTRPSLDLVARVPLENPRSIVDIGCGPGNSTEVLRRRWPAARVVGLDHSPAMLADAREKYPGGTWMLADARTWTADPPVDLVFSNATLQ